MAVKKKPLQASDIVIFGGTGDLSLRKIVPALYYRLKEGQLPTESRVFMLGRHAMTREAHIASIREACEKFVAEAELNDAAFEALCARLTYVQLEAKNAKDFAALAALLQDTPRPVRVFYLSTPAHIFGDICASLKAAELITPDSRVVMEKPIGHDLKTFRQINEQVLTCFDEKQVYRIDHYLGKETVQNLLVLRFANNVFERIWNNTVVDHVQITVSESTGLENRHDYYDDTGALRDMVQNHLLQLLCLVAMEPPSKVTPKTVRDEKLKVLRALRPMNAEMIKADLVRGQYAAGEIAGQHVPAYSDEIEASTSNTETYVALKAYVDNWRWANVPFYLRTGKRMRERYSEIVIDFHHVPHAIFEDHPTEDLSNKLIIRLQPDESVTFQMVTKVPGPGGYRLKPVNLNLSLADEFKERFPGAYERLLMDVVRGNPTLFMRTDEVESAWKWIETIMSHWQDSPLYSYPAGSDGPAEAHALLAREEREWYGGERRKD